MEIKQDCTGYRTSMKSLPYALKIACMKKNTTYFSICLLIACTVTPTLPVFAQPVLSTGGKKMPDEWIDSATYHKIIRLSRS